MAKACVLLGAGGHARVLLDILQAQGLKPQFCINPDPLPVHPLFAGIDWLDSDQALHQLNPQQVYLINGVGGLPGQSRRRDLFHQAKALGFQFLSVISDNALVSAFTELGEGVQIFPGAVINTGTRLGANVLVNTAAVIEHDCVIEDDTLIAPRAVLCGQVHCEPAVFVGAGAVVLQGLRLGRGAMVAAGTMLAHNLLSQDKVYPARTHLAPAAKE